MATNVLTAGIRNSPNRFTTPPTKKQKQKGNDWTFSYLSAVCVCVCWTFFCFTAALRVSLPLFFGGLVCTVVLAGAGMRIKEVLFGIAHPTERIYGHLGPLFNTLSFVFRIRQDKPQSTLVRRSDPAETRGQQPYPAQSSLRFCFQLISSFWPAGWLLVVLPSKLAHLAVGISTLCAVVNANHWRFISSPSRQSAAKCSNHLISFAAPIAEKKQNKSNQFNLINNRIIQVLIAIAKEKP